MARRDSWWARFVWVIDHSGTDLDATLTISMLGQLTTSARKLNDADLIAFAERYTRHAYASWGPVRRRSSTEAHTGTHESEGEPR